MFSIGKKYGKLSSAVIDSGYVKGLVSVVLPVYNGEKYIGKSIESVLNQSYQYLELIIVNDGSTDNTRAIIENYQQDKRVKIINQENRRLPGALNRGFEEARGEFYTWTSADNIMLEGCTKTMVEELEANKDADMVYGNMYLMDFEDNRITGHGWFEFPVGSGNVILPDSTLLLNTVANNTIGAAFMYRAGAECVLGGYSNRLYLLEDYDYFMKMNSLFKIRHISKKEPVYAYRMHKDSLTAHDEELGITASRPKLMKFDKIRRKVYNKPIYAKIQGNIPVDLKEVGIHDKKNSRILICDNHIYNEETHAEYIFEVKRCSDGSFEVKSNGKAVRLEDIRDTGLFLRYALWCRILRDAEAKYIL